jgi:release factor glutamine methyltransferase
MRWRIKQRCSANMQAIHARQQIMDQLTPRYGPGESASIARIVLEDAFQIRPGGLANTALNASQVIHLQNIIHRLLLGEPVQYVLGVAQFFGLNFEVNPAVLIPRQETEELVAWVLEFLKDRNTLAPVVMDIGLGSGCIGITLKAKRADIQLFGLEKSNEALKTAERNATRLLKGAPFHFIENDVLDQTQWPQLPDCDIIVSNPPYIPHDEIEHVSEEVHRFEPALALFVENEDPLIFYRAISNLAWLKLRSGGALFFECNAFNAQKVLDLVAKTGFLSHILRKDLAGADRMVMGVKP